eukprot:CAMPEP_0116150814 /NCGR_PEP_ID=MMETSP0329-20121206/19758_1 /TAXON_ID=697910 /ORGANISM="Pseudo-nitzschia arenysensis, Strain B593" /LENGTH=207 /DNA_ID=CAMNT_0003647373 /DNA_START=115 /DNA_END=735 /DNA_ORIENTATION=+
MALVANSFNILVLGLIPTGFLLRKGNKEQTPPLKILRKALFVTLVVILVSAIGVTTVFSRASGLNIKTSIVQNWFGLSTLVLYVYSIATIYTKYSIATIYTMLIVWMGFIKTENATSTGNKNKSSIQTIKNKHDVSFDAQLATFLMMVIPFRVAGSLVLVASERQAQQVSSWQTLLLFQIPVEIFVFLRLQQMWIVNDSIGSQKEFG